MTDQRFQPPSSFNFNFNPEPRNARSNITQGKGNTVEIVIVTQNCSGRPVKVHPILVPISSASAYDSAPVPPGEWLPWLSIPELKDNTELDFEPGGLHSFVVRISLPSYAPLAAYQFQLVLSGVDNPDEEYAASDPITFTVTGPKVDTRPFVIGAAIIMALVILGITAAVLLLNRSSLQVTVNFPDQVAEGDIIAYELHVLNSGANPVDNITIEYLLPENIVAATGYVPGEALRHCDFIREPNRSIRCDLDGLEAKGDPM
jgi:hypothetical protein